MANTARVSIDYTGEMTGQEKLIFVDDVIQFFSMLGNVTNIAKDSSEASASFDFEKVHKAADFIEGAE